VALEQHRRERRDVLAPCAQRREREVQDVQPVEEILAELTGGDARPCRSTLVAAITRTSIERSSVAPTRRTRAPAARG
jgi:hypothetical protein